MLDLDPAQVDLIELDVGGSFGARGEFYPEDFLIPLLALRHGRPVKWVEDRYEHLVAANHSREQVHEIELAAASDGTLLALRDRFRVDIGAYVRTQGVLLPLITIAQLVGPYAWQVFDLQAEAVLTPKTPAGTFRAPGVTEATFVRERLVDRVAGELGLDPVELRRRNLIPAEALPAVFQPHEPAPPVVYDGGDFPRVFEALLEEAGYDDALGARERARAEGRLVGIGVAAFTEMGGIGPFEEARIVPLPDGRFQVRCGIASLGQGVRTVLAQIAGDALAVPFDAVLVDHSDTDVLPTGFGAFASRSTVLAGNAVAAAAADLRGKAGEGALDAAALAAAGIVGEGRFEKEVPSFSFGANLSVVEVDADTGAVTVDRYFSVNDVGRVINPMVVRGQLEGGAVQGIGQALCEHFVYDADTGQALSATFMDYAIPHTRMIRHFDMDMDESSPCKVNALGVKGVGELGTIGATPTVVNAVVDALWRAGYQDAALKLQMPLTAERVWRAMS
jgi:carbon-monoxide dehydrogenase large subunit